MAPILTGDEVLNLRSDAGQAGHPLWLKGLRSALGVKYAAGLLPFLSFRGEQPTPSGGSRFRGGVARPAEVYPVAMAALGDMTPAYPGVAELTRQLDQEKIAMLSQRVDDLRNQNQDLKVPI